MSDDEETLPLLGCLDIVTEDGIVTGWSWDPNTPERRVELTILVDNFPVGNASAAKFRADLKSAGIGDGCHAFDFVLPWSLLGQKRTLQVNLREADTGRRVGEPFVLRQPIAVTMDERLGELEGQVRLLQSRCDELIRLSAQESGAATSVLFETIGSFFVQLAEDAKSGTPRRSTPRLGSLIETIVASHPTLNLPIPKTPIATIYIDACAPLHDIYTCISALYSRGICEDANIVLLDAGQYDDAALVPTVVRNLRYVHIWGEFLVECNKIASSAQTDIIVFLAAPALVSEGWLTEIAATFERDLKIAIVGGKIVREDGILQHTGLMMDPAGRVSDWGAGQLDDEPSCNISRPVDGFGRYAFAIRQSAFLEVGGFDPNFSEPAAAVLDLCIRLRGLGGIAQYQPLARAIWLDATASTYWVPGSTRA